MNAAAAFRVVRLGILAFLLDLPWLWMSSDWTASMFYKVQGNSLLRFQWWPAPVVYLAIGLLVTFASTAKEAALLGLATYAIYDFTNLATLKHYDARFAVADTVWGGFLFWLTWTVARSVGVIRV